MQFTGIFTTSTLMALAGLAAVAVTVLYVLKLRKRRVQVPFSPLWQKVLLEQRQSSDFWRRFKRIMSWLLHLIMAALIIVAMADPRSDAESTQGRAVVLMVDTSASMGATDVTGAVNRLDVAKRRALRYLESFGPEDRVMLVAFNDQVQPLSPFVREFSTLEQPLRTLEVSATGTRYEEALRYAADSVRDAQAAEVVVFTDGAGFSRDALGEIEFTEGVNIKHESVGESTGNLAITAFNVRRYIANKLDYELFVGVRSYFDRPVEAVVEIYADGKLVDTKPISLDALGEHRRFYPSQAVSGSRLEARVRLQTQDARDVFPLDDRAYALLPQIRSTRVQVVTGGNLYLEGPLVLNSNLDVTRVSPDEYVGGEGDFDVTLFDRFAPVDLPERGNFVFVGPPRENSPWESRGAVTDPIIERVKRSHPLMRWITLTDVNIAQAQNWRVQSGDDVVAASAMGVPLIVTRQDAGQRMVGIAFDLRDSDLPLRVAFPVFLLNTIDYFALEKDSLVEGFVTGEVWSIPVETEDAEVGVQRPDGTSEQVPVYDGQALVFGEQAGFYTITHSEGSREIAGNLSNVEESRIAPTPLRLGDADLEAEGPVVLFDRRELWIWIVLIAMAILLLEWATYNRRVTI